jgi:hypothetical protein
MNRITMPRRRLLAAVMLVAAALAALAWLVVVRPQRQQRRDGLDLLAEKRKALQRRGWPLDQEKLQQLLDSRTRVLEGDGAGQPGLKLRAEQVQQHATAMFRQRLQEKDDFKTADVFIRKASNIDFREAFNGLQKRLASDGILLVPELLHLAEDSSFPYTYQLLLQVWTLERAVELVRENRLQVLTDPKVKVRTDGGEQAAARITMQPIVAYYLEAGSPLPYLLAVPVRMHVAGQIDDVHAFILALTVAGNFLPPEHVEIYAEEPRIQCTRTPENGGPGRVVLDITCSGFFAFPGGDAAPLRAPPGMKPPAAEKAEAADGA